MFLLFALRLPYWVIISSAPPPGRPQGSPLLYTGRASRSAYSRGGDTCPPERMPCLGDRYPRPVSCGPYSAQSLFVVHDGAFDLFDQVGYVDATRAGIGAVEDGTAAPYAFLLAHDGEAFRCGLVATVEDEAVGVHDGSRANPVGIAPDRRTRTCAGGTEDALGALVIAGTLLRALQALRAGLRVVGDEVRLDRFVFGKKLV